MKNEKTVYLDNAAATPVAPSVYKKMLPYLGKFYANPSSIYSEAIMVREAVDKARACTAAIIGARPENIIFTSGGTESTNLAIFGLINKLEEKGEKASNLHIITTPIEHDAVLQPIKSLEKRGVVVTYLPVDNEGKISLRDLKGALRKETVLVSIMYANNEIGTINPISEIGREILRWRNKNLTIYPFFHSDACQAGGYLDLNVERLHVDFLSLNGSKIYGPKGIGILYKKTGVEILPIIYGGGQERQIRSGTPNVAGIIGFAESLSIAQKQKEKEAKKTETLRDYFWEQLRQVISDARLNGPVDNRLPNNLNVVIPEIESDEMIIYLNEQGVVCSSGSACAAESNEASHVLLSCGLPIELAKRSVRFTLGRQTTRREIDKAVVAIKKVLSLHAGAKLSFFDNNVGEKMIYEKV